MKKFSKRKDKSVCVCVLVCARVCEETGKRVGEQRRGARERKQRGRKAIKTPQRRKRQQRTALWCASVHTETHTKGDTQRERERERERDNKKQKD